MQLDGAGELAVGTRGPRLAVEDLSVYEQHGGHTLSRHTRLDQEEALRRIRSGAPASGAFVDRATAQRAVDDAIQRHRTRIAAWLWGPDSQKRYAFVENLGRVVGTMLSRQDVARGATAPLPATAVRLVLQPSDELAGGFSVVTAYPTRARRGGHHNRARAHERAGSGVPA